MKTITPKNVAKENYQFRLRVSKNYFFSGKYTVKKIPIRCVLAKTIISRLMPAKTIYYFAKNLKESASLWLLFFSPQIFRSKTNFRGLTF